MTWKKSLCAIGVAGLMAGAAQATVDLQITEIWAGGLEGAEATSDWFEVTNFGTSAATSLDGNLYYDDDSDDPAKNDPLTGIDTISPGESVVYLTSWEDEWTSLSDAITSFESVWGAPNGDLSSVQIGGVIGGSGQGGGGDAVNIFDGNTAGASTIDREGYSVSTQVESFVSDPLGNWTPVFAKDGVWGAYQGNLNASDQVSNPPIGSPGEVPEPGSLALLGLGGLALLGARRRRA